MRRDIVTRTKVRNATHIVLEAQCTTPIANASGSGRRQRHTGWFRDQFIFDLVDERHVRRRSRTKRSENFKYRERIEVWVEWKGCCARKRVLRDLWARDKGSAGRPWKIRDAAQPHIIKAALPPVIVTRHRSKVSRGEIRRWRGGSEDGG